MPEVKVIGMGFIPTQSDIVEFVKAGALGFILKDATVKEFLGTILSLVTKMLNGQKNRFDVQIGRKSVITVRLFFLGATIKTNRSPMQR